VNNIGERVEEKDGNMKRIPPTLAPTMNPATKKRPRRLQRDGAFLNLLTTSVMVSLSCSLDGRFTAVSAFQARMPTRLAFCPAARPITEMSTFLPADCGHFHEPRIRLRDSEGDQGATIVASTDLLSNQAPLANHNGAASASVSNGTNQTTCLLTNSGVSDVNGQNASTRTEEASNNNNDDDGDSSTTSEEMDVPLPTENGGFTHTSASRAKISAANKGKVPWNKGRSRSPQERARIAAGVRAKNRQRFLEKLQALGVTEGEYQEQKRAERRAKERERRARRTEKGGYRPTKETREKISKILKEKWSSGELKKRTVDPAKVRRGFTHSEETRAKISASLKKRWAQDDEYRKTMMRKTSASNSSEQVKKRISESLKKKWQDPEYRQEMLDKMEARRNAEDPHGQSHREKISAAMKAKWQDEEYRKKTIAAIQKKRAQTEALRPKQQTKAPRAIRASVASKPVDGVRAARPVQPKKRKRPVKTRVQKKSVAAAPVKPLNGITTAQVAKTLRTSSPSDESPVLKLDIDIHDTHEEEEEEDKQAASSLDAEPDGSINRLREERRDLYDLLYGDDGSSSAAHLDLGDENLDTFDPYGLEDF
jgi:hypothetical protein